MGLAGFRNLGKSTNSARLIKARIGMMIFMTCTPSPCTLRGKRDGVSEICPTPMQGDIQRPPSVNGEALTNIRTSHI